MAKNESIHEIGESIQSHRNMEISNFIQNCAIARYSCSFKSSLSPNNNGDKVFWLVNTDWNDLNNRRQISLKSPDGISICKNSKIGGLLTTGKEKETISNLKNCGRGRANEIEIKTYNNALYNLTLNSAKEITIYLNKQIYRYQTLEELRKERKAVSEKIEVLKRKQEETLKALETASNSSLIIQ